jgi:hypothetical protein
VLIVQTHFNLRDLVRKSVGECTVRHNWLISSALFVIVVVIDYARIVWQVDLCMSCGFCVDLCMYFPD